MKIQKHKEVIVEIEHVQVVRRRARVFSGFCTDCCSYADFLPLREAVRLFDVSAAALMRFIKINRCHFRTAADDVYICLAVLAAAMRIKTQNPCTRLIGDQRK